MYGGTLRKIRKGKNYSQLTLAAGRFTQGSYSYFEKNKSDMGATNFVFLLEQLQFTLKELLFIHNDYKLSPSEQIIEAFYKTPYNKKADLENLLCKIEAFLKENPSHIHINELKIICESLIILTSDNDIKGASKKVMVIWDRISKYDQYYLADIRILNSILFLFEFETIKFITKNLIQQLTKYNQFEEAIRLKNAIILNFSLICIRNNEFLLAMQYLEPIFTGNKQALSYVSTAIGFNRIAICLTYQNKKSFAEYLKKRDMLLYAHDDDLLKKRLEEEFNTYRFNH